MRAFQLVEWQQPPGAARRPVPEPGPGEVLVKVGGAGACHSDLHVMEWPAGTLPYELPFTLGHENAGWIEALGAGVKGWEVGERGRRLRPVGLRALPPVPDAGSRRCASARRRSAPPAAASAATAAWPSTCSSRPRGCSSPLGDLDPRDAAPLSDAALTPYHAIKLALHQLVPGTSAVVIGVGGLGHMAVQLLRALSPRARSSRPTSTPASSSSPAPSAPTTPSRPASDAAEEIRELTGGRGATLVLDCVGNDATLALDAQVVAKGGAVMVIGVAGGTLAVPLQHAAVRREPHPPVLGQRDRARGGPRAGAAGQITAHAERFPLERVADAYERMQNGTLSLGAPSSRRTADRTARLTIGGAFADIRAVCDVAQCN